MFLDNFSPPNVKEVIAQLRGKNLLIGTLHLPPYVFVETHEEGEFVQVDGYINQILRHLSIKFGFNYRHVLSRDGAYGAPINNGTGWNGLIGMVLDNQIDIAAAGLSVTYDRSKVVDFTAPIFEDPVSLLIPSPEIDGFPIQGIARAFQDEVWISAIGSMIACSFVLWIVSRLHYSRVRSYPRLPKNRDRRQVNHSRSTWDSVMFHPWTLFRILFNADYIKLGPLSSQITLGVWCIIAVVLVNAYTTSLMAHLTATKQKTMIDSIDDLVEMLSSQGREAVYMTLKYSAFETAIRKTSTGPLTKIRDSLEKHPEYLLTDETNITELVATHRRAYAEERSAILARIDQDWKKTGLCRLSIAKRPYDISKIALVLPKSSPFTKIFSEEIYRLRETGLLNHWYRTFSTKPNRCLAPLIDGGGGGSSTNGIRPRQGSRIRLTLSYLFGAFLILGVGFGIAIIAFIAELFFKI